MVNTTTNPSISRLSPLPPNAAGPSAPAPKPTLPEESFEAGPSSEGKGKFLLAAFSGLTLLAGAGAAQAQVQVVEQPVLASDLMKQLDEAMIKQGVQLEFMLPSPVGGGRVIDRDAAQEVFQQGGRVLVSEVTSESGPFRVDPSTLVRREVTLRGMEDLESYTRYFTDAKPQNEVESAAQKLKKHVYGQTDLTLLQRPDNSNDRPSLSPFEAARRLQQEQEVVVSTVSQDEFRLQEDVVLDSLDDIDSLITPTCLPFINFQMGPDGTIQLVQVPGC
jgi:hypothetical protein